MRPQFEVYHTNTQGSCMNCGNYDVLQFRLGQFLARLCTTCAKQLRRELKERL